MSQKILSPYKQNLHTWRGHWLQCHLVEQNRFCENSGAVQVLLVVNMDEIIHFKSTSEYCLLSPLIFVTSLIFFLTSLIFNGFRWGCSVIEVVDNWALLDRQECQQHVVTIKWPWFEKRTWPTTVTLNKSSRENCLRKAV